MWPSMHKPTIHHKIKIFSTNKNSIEDAISRCCIYVINGIYALLLTSWWSLVHKLGRDSLKTKRLVVGLLVHKVRIRNRKRAFLKMFIFNCPTLNVVLLEKNKSYGNKKDIVIISKRSVRRWCKNWVLIFCCEWSVYAWTVTYMGSRSFLHCAHFCQIGKICTLSSWNGYYEWTCWKTHVGVFPTIT